MALAALHPAKVELLMRTTQAVLSCLKQLETSGQSRCPVPAVEQGHGGKAFPKVKLEQGFLELSFDEE